MADTLQPLLDDLTIPEDFTRYDTISETDIIVRLENWRRRASTVLSDLRDHLEARQALTLDEQARVVSAVALFEDEGPWVLQPARERALELLERYATPNVELLERILNRHIRPLFQSNAHPSLNPSTGRTLPRPAGGSLAQQDYYEGQVWKTNPGLVNLVSWCVKHTESEVYERLWHLTIPPVMTLLDDYETRYKLRGIEIVADMLKKVPKGLLYRTGVDALLFSSLKTCLTFLQNPETPDLIRSAVRTALQLVLLTTSPDTMQRFNQLCEILGNGIIGSVWMYATLNPDALEASLEVLPEVVRTLDIGTVRYLSAIIPQLVFPLLPVPENSQSTRFKLLSVAALAVVISVCAPRMPQWKDNILEGILKCWVGLVDSGADDETETRKLKIALRDVCARLADTYPSVVDVEYARLLRVDSQMFEPLVGPLHDDGRSVDPTYILQP
ncbi:hypothetical protein SCP_0203230 [Sparassis crispa]|uniref:Uncharacterized protein n=1 Tax=Sparassis crispa TaxID=139825 RepID=A0A401GAB3_9APHY|nr:hypothetical protein SCP_0203230 [Sparassis crispa]GBE79126.1 hypothetical protein SCP_0203230 [Sparassis crispa]